MAVSITKLLAEIEELKERLEKYEPSGPNLANFKLQNGVDGEIELCYNDHENEDWTVLSFTKGGTIQLYSGMRSSKVFKTDKRGIVKVTKETPNILEGAI